MENQIVLISPGGAPDSGGLTNANEGNMYMYPYSIIFLHNYLLKQNIVSRVFDLFVEDSADVVNYCQGLKSPVVGITAQSYSSLSAVQIVRQIKALNPSVFIVAGGPHFGNCAGDTLKNIKEVDLVVRGEGEITFH